MYKIFAAIIKNMARRDDQHTPTETQYGFRKKRSTAQAIHIIRRIIDTACRAHGDLARLNMVLLDWEKAFDKVSHQGLYDPLERMAVAPELRSRI